MIGSHGLVVNLVVASHSRPAPGSIPGVSICFLVFRSLPPGHALPSEYIFFYLRGVGHESFVGYTTKALLETANQMSYEPLQPAILP